MAKQSKPLVRVRADAKPDYQGQAFQALDRKLPANGGMSAQDTLVNLVTGMGTEKDKLAGTIFGYGELPKQQLDAAYRGDWISRKTVDIPAFDAFREWRSWQADKTDITAIEETEKKLKLLRKSMLADIRGRLYGGGALIMGVDQGNSAEELVIESVAKDALKFVHAVSRHELANGPIDWDVMSPYFGEPTYYEVVNRGGGIILRLHPSRVVRFMGAESADPFTTSTGGWGDSILQVCADAILACGTVASSTAQLIAEAKIDIVKMPDLSERIVNKEYENRLKNRFGLANTMKSVFGMLIVDKEEEWARIQQTFTGLDDLLKMYLLIVTGAADIPATRFLGQSPAGLNATGDSDTRNYYDRVSTEQNIVISPAMERLDRVLLRSTFGAEPDGIFYEWNPLWQMTDAEKAAVAVQKSQVMTADATAALMTPLVLQKARENQLIEDGTYPGLEQLIEEFGDDIDVREPLPSELPPVDPNAPPVPGAPAAPGAKGVPAAKPAANGAAKGAKGAKVNSGEGKPDGSRTAAASASVGDGMAERVRKGAGKKRSSRTRHSPSYGMADATTPRTLYVRRDVLNQDEIKAWAKKQGFKSTLDDMHVTILYSKTPVDWLKVGTDDYSSSPDSSGNLMVKPGGPRVIEVFGKAIVLAFANSDLQYRHKSAMYRCEEDGINWKYDDYTPHVTITYQPGDVDPMQVVPYDGAIELGPEIFEEIKADFNNEEDTAESDYTADYNPNHVPSGINGGEFMSGTSGEGGRDDLIRSIAMSKHSVSHLKNKHQLIPTEVAYLKRLRKPE